MPNQTWRLLPFAAALFATATAAPALADDWDICAKSSGDEAIEVGVDFAFIEAGLIADVDWAFPTEVQGLEDQASSGGFQGREL